jgi:multiple sugar transport system permease protein
MSENAVGAPVSKWPLWKRPRTAQGGRRRFGDVFVYGVLLTPYGLVMTAFTVLALGFGITLSFLNIDLLAPSPTHFVGITNYTAAFSDPTFLSSLKITVLLLTVPVIIEVGMGLLAAFIVQNLRHSSTIQIALMIPMFVAPVVAGLFWKLIMQPDLGGLDSLLRLLHLPAPAWLDHGSTALVAVMIADVWEWFPFAFIFLLAALKSLPTEPYEAARIDGAKEFQTFRYLTLPLLRVPLTTVVLLEVVNGLFLLPLIYTMTGGGPGQTTEPLDYYAFIQGFNYFNLSYAGALLVLLLLVVMIPCVFLVFRLRKAMPNR